MVGSQGRRRDGLAHRTNYPRPVQFVPRRLFARGSRPFDPPTTALVIIDMQRDFVEPGGFGELLGNDVTPLRQVIAPIYLVDAAAECILIAAWLRALAREWGGSRQAGAA